MTFWLRFPHKKNQYRVLFKLEITVLERKKEKIDRWRKRRKKSNGRLSSFFFISFFFDFLPLNAPFRK